MGNLGKAIRKNLSHLFIIMLWFLALYDFVAHFTTRINVDPKVTYTIFALLPLGLLLNCIWMILLAFCNTRHWMVYWKKEKNCVVNIFPLFYIPLTATIFGLLYYDNSYTSYQWACFAIFALLSIYLHTFLRSEYLIPQTLRSDASVRLNER